MQNGTAIVREDPWFFRNMKEMLNQGRDRMAQFVTTPRCTVPASERNEYLKTVKILQKRTRTRVKRPALFCLARSSTGARSRS